MEMRIVGFVLGMLEPGVARRRARLAGWTTLVVGYVWIRSVLAGDAARAARIAARRERETRVASRMRERLARMERSL